MQVKKNDAGEVERTVYRLRFRQFAGLNDELLMRVYFDDTRRPVVTAWSEIGERLSDPRELGAALGLPVSETLVLTMSGVDYVDLDVPGDGANIAGVFLGTVRKVQTLALADFAAAPDLLDPFGAPAATGETTAEDALLLGRVKATLDRGTTVLNAAQPAATFEFELNAQPDLALVTFEILDAEIANPPRVFINETDAGVAAITAPDLADPGYRRSDRRVNFQGWLKVQKALPAALVSAGSHRLTIKPPAQSEPVAIRAVEVQLKYHSRNP